MVGRIAEKWHFCYTIHKTPHLSLFWIDGGNDDGVLLPVVLLLLFLSQSDSSVRQTETSLSLCDDPYSFLGSRKKHTCSLYQLPRKQKKVDRENIIPLFIHLTFLNSTFSHQEKQSNSNLEELQNSLFSNIKKPKVLYRFRCKASWSWDTQTHDTHDTHRLLIT